MIDPSSSVDITPYQYHQYKLPSCNVRGLMQADIGWYAEDNDSNGTFLRIILGGVIALTLMIIFYLMSSWREVECLSYGDGKAK